MRENMSGCFFSEHSSETVSKKLKFLVNIINTLNHDTGDSDATNTEINTVSE